jgi:hypothetical protein
MYPGDNNYECDNHGNILQDEKNDEWHSDAKIAIVKGMYAYDKDRLYGSYEELGSDLLVDIPFDAVAIGVMKADGEFSTNEEQRSERGEVSEKDEVRLNRSTFAWRRQNSGRRRKAIWNRMYWSY